MDERDLADLVAGLQATVDSFTPEERAATLAMMQALVAGEEPAVDVQGCSGPALVAGEEPAVEVPGCSGPDTPGGPLLALCARKLDPLRTEVYTCERATRARVSLFVVELTGVGRGARTWRTPWPYMIAHADGAGETDGAVRFVHRERPEFWCAVPRTTMPTSDA